MPKETPVMRARTRKEGVGDFIRDAYESVSEQPLARIADMLGMSDIAGVKKTFTTPDDGIRIGAMPGGPAGKGLAAIGKGLAAIGRNRGINPGRLSWEEAIKGNAGGNNFRGLREAMSPSPRPAAGNLEGRGGLGGYLPAEAKVSHPSLPPEFQEIMAKPKLPQSRTAPIDMDNLPSGKMEYLDPDVAEYMNPKPMTDFTDPATQRRLRFLTGK